MNARRRRAWAVWCAATLAGVSAWAGRASAAESPTKPRQSEIPASINSNPYKVERWEEDYSYLRTAPRQDFFDPAKYIPLNASGDWYASFGAQIRDRYEYWNNNNFGAGAQDGDGFNLLRLTGHVDLHLSPYFRVFVEGRGAFQNDREGGPRASDYDQLDPQQAFGQFNLPFNKKGDGFMFRAGRQEIILGAERLFGISDFSNVRKTHDGYRATLTTGDNTLDAFFTRPVIVDRYDFDPTNTGVIFGGLYDTLKLPNLIAKANSKVEVYGLYLERDNGSYPTAGAGREERYTVGVRFSTQPKPFDLDVELDYQWGRFNGSDVSAYSLAVDAGYTVAGAPFSPRLFVGFDIASGDSSPGGDVHTFNQLYPSGHTYFGYIDVVGRQNIIDLHPGVDLTLVQGARYAQRVGLRAEYHQFWRQSDSDALYAASGAVLRSGAGSDSMNIGGELDLLLKWQIDRHWSAYAGYSHFFHESFISDTGASDDIDFFYAAVTFTF